MVTLTGKHLCDLQRREERQVGTGMKMSQGDQIHARTPLHTLKHTGAFSLNILSQLQNESVGFPARAESCYERDFPSMPSGFSPVTR